MMEQFSNDFTRRAPQGAPTQARQSLAEGTQGAPAWVGQSSALPVGVQPTALERSASWPALRLIARWLKVIAWIELVFGVIISLVAGSSLSALGGFGGFSIVLILFLLVGTTIGFILTFASAELILVFLAIEKNTRKQE